MLEIFEQEATNVITTVITLLPDLLGAVLMLLLGWLLARFLRMAITRLARAFNTLVAGRFYGTNSEFARIPTTVQQLLGATVFWATILVFVAVSVRLMGFDGVAHWLERLVVYLPSLLSGGLIIIAGAIIGSASRKLITHAAETADIARPELLGQSSQVAFIVVGLIIGLGQIGVDVTFLIMLFGIVLATVLAGFSLAFGLGAKPLVENLIANQHLKLLVKPGQQVACGSLHGRVLEFTATGVLLETEHGRTLLPAKLFMEQSLSLITSEKKDGN
ncbi:mechanosensitive ion channel family protein [Zhongshania arctica]|uniref:Small-conductance mechanosensitive channel n=1 Tax=Zhongshania arctica TaxID=3238302 RepID=A0ABV3TVE9_9GAMM